VKALPAAASDRKMELQVYLFSKSMPATPRGASIMFTTSPCTLVMAEESSYTQLIL
jgi:hypothetical protein